MENRRYPLNEQRKTQKKLLEVNQELQELDKEIGDIQNELNVSRSLSADDLTAHHNGFPNKQGERLYQKSIQALNKRNQIFDDDYSIDPIPPPKRKIKIKDYRPPCERIFDINEKKLRLLNHIREENEKQFAEECTFKPKINEESYGIKYDPTHLTKPKNKVDNTKNQEKGKKIYVHKKGENGIYDRQVHKNTYVPQEKVKGNVISPQEEKDLIERLTKKKERSKVEIEHHQPKFISKQSLNRLIKDSIKKNVPEEEEEIEQPPCLMNKKSQKLTKDKNVDLYGEYLDAKERINQKRADYLEWQRMVEENENNNAEQVKYKKINIDNNPNVAGMDQFVERMKSKPQLPQEELPKHIPAVIIAKPFSFEIRDQINKHANSDSVMAVLGEINNILQSVE